MSQRSISQHRHRFANTLATLSLTAAVALASATAVAQQPEHAHQTDQQTAQYGQDVAATTPAAQRKAATDSTEAFSSAHKQWAQAQGASNKAAALQGLIAKAEARRDMLAELIQTNPAEVLRVAIPEEKQQRMPAEVQAMLEQRFEVEGELDALYEDYEDGTHKLRHFLKTPFGERFELKIAGKQPQQRSGSQVQVSGVLLDGVANEESISGTMALETAENSILTLAADGGTDGGSNEGVAAALPNTFGEQKTLVMLVNFQDDPNNRPWTTSEINNQVFGDVNDFYLENSAGQSWLTGDVTGWLTLPLNSTSCDQWGISSAANNAAAASGVDLSAYGRLVYVFPRNACSWGGLGTVGGSQTKAWINGTPNTHYIGHELGHNFGLFHSDSFECSEGTLEGDCYDVGYGDKLDIMGSASTGHFNAFQKDRLGWFNGGSAASLQTIDSSGSFELNSYELPTASSPTALKVLQGIDATTGYKTWYYIEFRQATGFDSFLSDNQNVLNGLVIHRGTENNSKSSRLLDMTPGSSNYFDMNDPALEVGNTFTDPDAGISLTTLTAESGKATLYVELGPQPCVTQAPELIMQSGQSDWGNPGTAVSYNLTLTNRDSLSCNNTNYDLSASIPTGWSFSLSENQVSLAPGTSTTISLTVTSTSSANDGFYNIGISAASVNGSDTVTASYVISTPAVNTEPVAMSDSVTTSAEMAIKIPVLNNDSDSDGDSLTITTFTQGANGTVTLNSDNSLTYSPHQGFSGTDNFSYSISDGQGGSASAAVYVNVEAPVVNLPPVAVDDSSSTLENTAIIISVMNNDSDPENAAIDVSSVSQASNGQVQINNDGTLTYTPNRRFKGGDSFHYTITDGTHTATAWVTISVNKKSGGGNNTGKGGGKSGK